MSARIRNLPRIRNAPPVIPPDASKKNGRRTQHKELRAVVIGAGVAGLTAAHELAERHFKVWVVESTRDVDRHAQMSMAIGGMARTQYVAARTAIYPDTTYQAISLTPVVVFDERHLEEQVQQYVKHFLQANSYLELYGPGPLRGKINARLQPKVKVKVREGEFWRPRYQNNELALIRRPRMVWIDV